MSFSLMRTVAVVLSAGLLLSAWASGARSDFGLKGEALGRTGEAWK
ncbi:hypothetical protein [Brevundimonas sp.]